MQNLINDLSTITSADKSVFEKLVYNSIYCICDYVEDAVLNNEPNCDIDIGIGILKIKIGDGVISYSFVPSQAFEGGIISTVENQQNFLVASVNNLLVGRLNKLYDNLL